MKKTKKDKLILIAIISIIVILITIILAIKIVTKKEDNQSDMENNENQSTTVKNDKENEELIEKLKDVSESERIRIYLGKYFKYLESKDYESAYELLYPSFKQNYFPTIEEYKEYIKEQNLPEMMSIDYQDIYRQGETYVVTIVIGDFLSRATPLSEEKTFLVKENGYNDYYISLKK